MLLCQAQQQNIKALSILISQCDFYSLYPSRVPKATERQMQNGGNEGVRKRVRDTLETMVSSCIFGHKQVQASQGERQAQLCSNVLAMSWRQIILGNSRTFWYIFNWLQKATPFVRRNFYSKTTNLNICRILKKTTISKLMSYIKDHVMYLIQVNL